MNFKGKNKLKLKLKKCVKTHQFMSLELKNLNEKPDLIVPDFLWKIYQKALQKLLY